MVRLATVVALLVPSAGRLPTHLAGAVPSDVSWAATVVATLGHRLCAVALDVASLATVIAGP